MTETSCGRIPPAPPYVDINGNIDVARDFSWWADPGALRAFYDLVKNHGFWDYKRRGRKYEDFGNFNFGATAAAMGMPHYIAQNGAGIVQLIYPSAGAGKGFPFFRLPYGDDPSDAGEIQAGYNYYNCKCK